MSLGPLFLHVEKFLVRYLREFSIVHFVQFDTHLSCKVAIIVW